MLRLLELPRSTFYYLDKKKEEKKSSRPSKTTLFKDEKVDNSVVVAAIRKVLGHKFKDYYGYHKISRELRREGFIINHKKVYRLMQENKLMKKNTRVKRSGSGRKFVKYRVVNTSRPMEVLEMDIKFVWVPEKGKNAYLLSIIDVHSRVILNQMFSFSIKKEQVMELCAEVIDTLSFEGQIVIRSDNGSQFIAREVREYLGDMGVSQEFTHVATPEENAHIEAFHGILKKELLDRFEYYTFQEIDELIKEYMVFYNTDRIHGKLGYRIPQEVFDREYGRALAA